MDGVDGVDGVDVLVQAGSDQATAGWTAGWTTYLRVNWSGSSLSLAQASSNTSRR